MTFVHRIFPGKFLRSFVTFFVGLTALCAAVRWWTQSATLHAPVTHEDRLIFANAVDVENHWETFDYTRADVPGKIVTLSTQLTITEGTVKFRHLAMYYREIVPQKPHPRFHVLLMHGRHYTSKTWAELGTLNLVAAMGFRVVAVDMPGFGKTQIGRIGDRDTFMSALISALNLTKPVIVTPSWSGYLVLAHTAIYWKDMTGLVAISPIGWEAFELACNNTTEDKAKKPEEEAKTKKTKVKEGKGKDNKSKDSKSKSNKEKVDQSKGSKGKGDKKKDTEAKDVEKEQTEKGKKVGAQKKTKDQVYKSLQPFLPENIPDVSCVLVPTMVVFGDRDRSASAAYLSLLPNSRTAEIHNAKHAAYLDKPALWHKLLYNFLMRLFYESREV